ncbi:MAG TPA: hypothetical protein VKB90_02795, partial [Candidatus Acidoferrum sp.]|nr:hypothetical protein [Candidatus Acidoferrum sp.]
IRVTSIVGRFLEHGRVYYFRNGGAPEVYLGSADLMRRNLSHRVEIIFPVRGPKLVRRLKDILDLQLSDEKKAHLLQSDGSYCRSNRQDQPEAVDSQLRFLTSEDSPTKTAKGLAVLARKRLVADRRADRRTKI